MNNFLHQLSCILFIALVSQLSHSAEPPAPELPLIPSPIEDFRQMLRAKGEERERLLLDRPEQKRAVLRRKCEFYDKLPEAERERRLKMLELRWFLQPLMSQSPEERATMITGIPPEFRRLVTERLAQWDKLPAEDKKRYLDNEMALQYFTRLQQASPAAQQSIPGITDAGQRQRMEEKLAAWRKLSARERQRSYQHFNRFFELPRQEQEKTLDVLSETERNEMQNTLDAFAQLPPEQRRACINAFQKFASMTPAQRLEFFRNAQRWQTMSRKEREQWRNLVNNLPPTPPDGLPPIPGARPAPNSGASNTFGN